MKITFLQIKLFTYLSIIIFACAAQGQTPTAPSATPAPEVSPAASAPETAAVSASVTPPANATLAPTASLAPAATVAPAATLAPTVAPSASPDTEEDFDKAIERKIRKHFSVNMDGDHPNSATGMEWVAIPIVLIVFLTIFGLPVAIVGTILYFSFSRSRAMHKTVRLMVEKGQPVPEALLNPPPVVRQRSDLRRGIILLTVGAGLVVFLGATNEWEGGAWSIGIIPFMIGLGYLLVWKLDVRTHDTSPKV